MIQTVVSRIFWFVLLTLLQALVCNHIHILGYATPLPYIYFLLILPGNTPRWLYILLGFALGLLIDASCNTPGVAAAATTAGGLLTPWLLHLFAPKDYDENTPLLPSVHTMEWGAFLRFATTVTVLHCLLFFSLEAFNLFHLPDVLINTLGSSALTILFIAAFELIRNEK